MESQCFHRKGRLTPHLSKPPVLYVYRKRRRRRWPKRPPFFTNYYYLWSLFCIQIKRVANDTAFGPLHTSLHKLVVNRLLYETAAASAATLTLVEEQSKVTHFHCAVDIGISKHHVRTLATKFQGDVLQIASASCLHNYMPNLRDKITREKSNIRFLQE